MINVGERLREARERRGLSIEEASRLTKIRVEQIRDMEDGDFSNFPGFVYAKSFLKLYGKFLKIDISDAFEYFDPAPSRQERAVFFHRPIAIAGRAKPPPPRRHRSRGGGSHLPIYSVNFPRVSFPSTKKGLLLWIISLALAIGVFLAIKFTIDLERLKRSLPAESTVAEIEGNTQKTPKTSSAPDSLVSNTKKSDVADLSAPVTNNVGRASDSQEPVLRAEPTGRLILPPDTTASESPTSALNPLPRSYSPQRVSPNEVRRAERVERVLPATP